MKFIACVILLVLNPYFSICQSGENIYFKGTYKVEAYFKGNKILNDSCILNVSKNYSYFFSLGNKAFNEKARLDFESTGEISKKVTCTDCFPYTFFKDYSKKVVYRLQALMGTFYAFSQPSSNNINWKLTNDSLMINEINCFKAIGKVDTITYIAYYAPSIPISDGPSILMGLPGLILKSESSTGLKTELLSLKFFKNSSEENKYSSKFQFTTYEQFKAAEASIKDALQSGKEVQMANGATIRRTN